MRSINEILNLVVDGKITTRVAAAELIDEEVADRVHLCSIPKAQARADLLDAIGFATTSMTEARADFVMDLFQCEHPVFGKTHPTPEEALRLGEEYAMRKQKENN
jgi:hypothetical protein